MDQSIWQEFSHNLLYYLKSVGHFLFVHLLPFGIAAVVVPVLTFFGLRYLAKRVAAGKAQDVEYARIALEILKSVLSAKLGDKADAVFDVWIGALDTVKDGQFTPEEAKAEIIKSIQAALALQQVNLTPEEHGAVVDATHQAVEMLSVKPTATAGAVSALQVQALGAKK